MLGGYFVNVWQVINDLAPALLFGLLIAGVLHVYLPENLIHSQLNRPDFRSVLRAVLVGVPMPLCSCGVVPTAISLKNEGASKGATTAFLISTPQTGVDSIFVSVSFLGWPFALFKVGAAFLTGLIGGMIVNIVEAEPGIVPQKRDRENTRLRGVSGLIEVFRYGLLDLLAMIDLWLIGGIAISALITLLVPPGYLNDVVWAQGIGGMFLMLLISMPMYVCTTSSVPIAAAMIHAGLPLGSALVFLMAGPATNAATLGMIYRGLGGKVLAVFLSVVAVMSMVLAWFFDFVLNVEGGVSDHLHHEYRWYSSISSVVLLVLLVFLSQKRIARRLNRLGAKPQVRPKTAGQQLKVHGMTCAHCVERVKEALAGLPGIERAEVDLSTGLVQVIGSGIKREVLIAAVERAGYKVE